MKVRTPDAVRRARIVANSFCPTGQGGGVDPTCSPGKAKKGKRPAWTNDPAHKEVADLYESSTGKAREVIGNALENSGRMDYDEKTGGRKWAKEPPEDESDRHALTQGLAGGHRFQQTSGHTAAEQAPVVDALHALGADPIGGAGERVPFSGTLHHDVPGIPTGTSVEVVHPGWSVDDNGYKRVLTKSIVKLPGTPSPPPTANARRRKKSSRPSPSAGRGILRTDPTRTATLRRAFAARVSRAFARFRLAVYDLIAREDAFGLVVNSFCPTGKGGGVDPTCSPGQNGFKEWFEGSKVVDAEGNPLIVHHGGGTQIENFSTEQSKGVGIWFAEKEGAAKKYAKSTATPSVTSVYLVIKNPVPRAKYIETFQEFSHLPSGRVRDAAVVERLKELGYDGQKDRVPGSDTWSVFDSSQIRIVSSKKVQEPPTANARLDFSSDQEKIRAFQEWLRQQLDSLLLSKTEAELWAQYVQDGYRKGAGRAFDDARVAERAELYGGDEKLDFYAGTKEEFLRSSFGAPVAVEKVQLLASRTFDELKGITSDMSLRMSRALTDGLVQGKSPRDVARDLAAQVDIGRDRALVIAQTELSRAHAEGQLTALEQLGVEEVGAMIEWTTTPDSKVCPKCRPLQGVVLTIAEARGMLPRHPRCRCAWTPANVGEDQNDQKRSPASIRSAIRDSNKAAGKRGDGFGPGAPISTDRPAANNVLDEFSRLLANSFCATGPGGGVDPTCSPGDKVPNPLPRASAELEGRVEKALKDYAHPDTIREFISYSQSTERVAISQLVSPQTVKDVESVKYFKKNQKAIGDTEPLPLVIQFGPHLFLRDGNSRATASVELGRGDLKARVVYVPFDGGT